MHNTLPKFIKVLGFQVFSDNLGLIPINDRQTRVINTISPNSYGIAVRDTTFRRALVESDYLVLDGVYFALASLLLHGTNIKRNQGPDVFAHFMDRLNHEGGKAFFLGSTTEVLGKIEDRACQEYGNILVKTYSPPFKNEHSDSDNDTMISAVNEFRPDVLFIGMTCPKQEKWAIRNKEAINAGLIISVGNVFDWFAGTQKVIHPVWFKLRLGWLVRIFYRPEIFRRNIKNQMKFFTDLVLYFFRLKKR